ncbi:MAG: hypothetical protein Q9188_000660 [Gyalolechia gomerana]
MKSRLAGLLAKTNLPELVLLSRYRPMYPDRSSDEHFDEPHSKTCQDIQIPAWKPATLRRPLLLSIVALTISFIAILEYLSQKSHVDGGIAFARLQFSSAITFGYVYLPTVLAVIYSTVWSWIDLDAKRLEPWFQLSKPDGAKARDSLLLHYPFDFLAVAPLKALRKKHWAVVSAGTSTMLIFWGVTPLVGSVFTMSAVTVEKGVTVRTTASLMPLLNQSRSLNTNFLMSAYGIAWLGQSMPGFVTGQGALEPFEADQAAQMQLAQLTTPSVTVKNKLYGTSLSCDQAEIRKHPTGDSYSNRKGCMTFPGALNINPLSQYGGLYVGYYLDQHSDFSLSGCGCPSPNNSHTFLALWGESRGKNPNVSVTAYFCEPSYWVQDVNATVAFPSMNVSAVVPLGPRTALSDDHFNRSAFEYTIGTGAQSASQRADISETTSVIDQRANLAKLGFNYTVTNMLGFALGLSRLSLAQYAEPDHLISSFETAHQLLHALAVTDLMTEEVSEHNERRGTISGEVFAYIIVRQLAIAVECVLGLVVILIIALYILSTRRDSQLHRDPASLTDLIKIMSGSIKDSNLYDTYEHGLNEPPTKLIGGKMTRVRMASCRKSDIDECHATSSREAVASTRQLSQMKQGAASRVRPFQMSLTVAFVFLVLLGGSIVAVVVLKIIIDERNGLPLPSASTTVNQLVLNYIPVIFATFLEPFWLLLNRILCVLQPFEELAAADAKSSRSLDLKYTSLPPQLVVWRALRARHYILSSVCAIGLSANLLAISLNGLLTEQPVLMDSAHNFTLTYKPEFGTSVQRTESWDYQYVAKTNISDGVSLPPWTVPGLYFVPFGHVPESDSDLVASLTAKTQGFGIQANCQRSTFNSTSVITGQQNFFFVKEQTPTGSPITCGGVSRPYGGQNLSLAALEVFTQLDPVSIDQPDLGISSRTNILANATLEEQLTCNSLVVAGFLRGNLTVSFNDTKTENSDISQNPDILGINSLSSTWMTCKPKLVTGLYDVTVDSNGHVDSYEAAGPSDRDPSSFCVNGTTPAALVATALSILTNGANTGPYWHNDTFVDTWFAYFVKHLSNSTMFVDPAAPVPQYNLVAPYVEDIFARLFAIVLSLNEDWLSPAEVDSTIPGTVLVHRERVFMSGPMFFISVVLLALNTVVAVAYWAWRPKKILQHMPYTIGKTMDLFRGSGLIFDVEDREKWEKWKFGYGRFVGRGGKLYEGIERRPFVIPLDS